MDETANPWLPDRPTDPATNPWATPPTDPPTDSWSAPRTAPAPVPVGSDEPEPPTCPARRRVSRPLIVLVVVSALLAAGAGFWLHQTSQDRNRAQAQAARARSNLDDEQAQETIAHDDLSQALLPGRALDSALAKPMATIGQLNSLDKDAETQMSTELQTGEAGISGVTGYNRAVDAANADVGQANNLFQQMLDQTKDLPVD